MLEASTSLTIALDKGNHSYLLSVGRIGEYASDNWAYHQHDALGSLRQLTDSEGAVTLSRSYMPYGDELSNAGNGASSYAFAGEWRDSTGLIFLRARFYAPWDGRLLTQDPWAGNAQQPISYNPWLYGYANPVMMTDPSGMIPRPESPCDRLPPEDAYRCRKYLEECRIGCNSIVPSPLPETPPPPIRNDSSYDNVGKWFYHLLKTVPGKWNKYGYATHDEITEKFFTYGFTSELSTNQYDDPLLPEAMAQAFARKAWHIGIFRFVGSRESMYNRMMQVLYSDYGPKDDGGTWGYWCGESRRAEAFISMMSALQPRYERAKPYGMMIWQNTHWHGMAPHKPHEWGNLEGGGKETDIFMEWINDFTAKRVQNPPQEVKSLI